VRDLRPFVDTFLDRRQTRELEPDGGLSIGDLSLPEAYEVQQRVIDARVARGEKVVGYKVGCTSRAIRRQFALAEPICGRLMAPHVHRGDVALEWRDCCRPAVEPELVLTVGRDLTEEVDDEADLTAAIESVAPGIEVHHYHFRFGRPTLQELVASNGIHASLVVGKPIAVPGGFDWKMEGVGLFVGGELAASGIGAEIMGGPMQSFAWLVNHLVRRGDGLKAGQLVIPGSAVELIPVQAGDRVSAAFTHVGTVEAVFR
jgi:2-keto-4-pentenoate hydratase